MIQRKIIRRPQEIQESKPINKKRILEDTESLFTYDDEVPNIYDDSFEYTSPKKPQEQPKGPVGGQLERIEEKLAKIERMLQQIINQNASKVAYDEITPQQSIPQIPQAQPARGSMLSEIQAMVAQQGGVGPELGAMQPPQQISEQFNMQNNMPIDTMSSIATMSSTSYDDDVPNILGID